MLDGDLGEVLIEPARFVLGPDDMIPAVVVSVIYAYSSAFRALTLDATLVIAVTFLGSSIAAAILPWYKPAIFDNSPVAHLRVAISGAGLITSIILAWTITLWLKDPLYGIGVGNVDSIKFLGVVYGAAALLYIAARLYRRSQGVDLDAIHGRGDRRGHQHPARPGLGSDPRPR